MNSLSFGCFCRANDGRDIQVALKRRRRPNADCLIAKSDMDRLRIHLRVNGDWRDSQIAAGANYSYRDLASVSNQDLAKHEIGGQWSVVSSDELGGSINNNALQVYRASRCAETGLVF